MRKLSGWGFGIVTTAVAMALPATAGAADFFVDNGATPGSACTQADPCPLDEGIIAGVATTGNTVHLDDAATPYVVGPSALSLSNGVSVIGDNFRDGVESVGGRPIIDQSMTATTFDVPVGQAGGNISGLTLRPDNGNSAIRVLGSIGTIQNNQFIDIGTASEQDVGVVLSGPATSITANTFSNLNTGIRIQGGASTEVVGNEISATTTPFGSGLEFNNPGVVTVIANNLHDPVSTIATGLNMIGGPAPSLRRNRISGYQNGVTAGNTSGTLTLDSDMILGSTAHGVLSSGTGVGATNATIVSANGATADLGSNTSTTINSSIISDRGVVLTGGTCTTSFSRGPQLDSCSYATNADPMLSADGHLLVGSPMIDMGDTVAPSGGSLDIDGQARALAGACGGVVRRDIGADEFSPNCAAPQQQQQQTAVNPLCAVLTEKISKLSKRIKQAEDPDKKKKLRERRKKARKQFSELGCP